MARYIDKDALLEFLKVNKYEEPSTDFQRGANANADLIFGEIKYFHTADVAQVVRCKDCKYCEHCYPVKAIGGEAVEGWYCKIQKRRMRHDDFCSYGKRKEDK